MPESYTSPPTLAYQALNDNMSQNTNTHQPKEESFSILPHPATTNDPKTDPALQAGNPGSHAGAREPHVPSADVAAGLEQPKSREELQSLKASLNKED